MANITLHDFLDLKFPLSQEEIREISQKSQKLSPVERKELFSQLKDKTKFPSWNHEQLDQLTSLLSADSSSQENSCFLPDKDYNQNMSARSTINSLDENIIKSLNLSPLRHNKALSEEISMSPGRFTSPRLSSYISNYLNSESALIYDPLELSEKLTFLTHYVEKQKYKFFILWKLKAAKGKLIEKIKKFGNILNRAKLGLQHAYVIWKAKTKAPNLSTIINDIYRAGKILSNFPLKMMGDSFTKLKFYDPKKTRNAIKNFIFFSSNRLRLAINTWKSFTKENKHQSRNIKSIAILRLMAYYKYCQRHYSSTVMNKWKKVFAKKKYEGLFLYNSIFNINRKLYKPCFELIKNYKKKQPEIKTCVLNGSFSLEKIKSEAGLENYSVVRVRKILSKKRKPSIRKGDLLFFSLLFNNLKAKQHRQVFKLFQRL
ncbi:unnamed protein product [Blepharisma stoltei]|uniref:Uncharacterized protein n=1 Tax=Blepharisma stoltei TaxID=1481888 RepID=A0AAU9IS24_9CILI|nr:unnamed protein product [Blepharisma stoltei]